jgi:putative transposase
MLTGATSIVAMAVLVCAVFNDELRFLEENLPAQSVTPSAAPESPVGLPLSDYPAELVAIARERLEVIRPLLALPKRSRADVVAHVQTLTAAPVRPSEPVSVATVYRWLTVYTRSGFDLRTLIPAVHERGGKDHSRLRPEVNTLVEIVLRDKSAVSEKFSVDDVRNELAVRLAEENRIRPAADQLRLPSRATLARRLAASPERQAAPSRTDIRVLGQLAQTPYPVLPLERVEIDHTRSDLIVIDDRDNLPLGRLTLTYCLDLATRYPLGYYLGFEPPSYLTVMECLHHAILPKGDVRAQYDTEHDWQAYGIPATLVIDNGKEFIGRDLEDACCLLGTVLQYTPVRTPQFKAGVERMFGTLNTLLFHTLPGTTFSNPTERGTYNSVQQACVYLSEVDKVLHLFLLDIYAERFHQGLKGIPARCWEEKTRHGFAPPLPPGAQELSILLSRTETRVLQPAGIKFASLRYNDDSLLTLRTRLKGQATQIKYHPADLSCLYVFDPFERSYLRVPALDQEYTQGLSLWKHRVIRQAVLEEQAQVNPVALGLAKRKIQAIVEDGRQRKRLQTRTRGARWETAGKPTRQIAVESALSDSDEEPLQIESSASVTAPNSLDAVALDSLEEAGWEVCYVPGVVTNAEVQHD